MRGRSEVNGWTRHGAELAYRVVFVVEQNFANREMWDSSNGRMGQVETASAER